MGWQFKARIIIYLMKAKTYIRLKEAKGTKYFQRQFLIIPNTWKKDILMVLSSIYLKKKV